MATVQKIVLSASRDIPFNKLILSQSNVRRVKAGISIEELADDIARRTLLQSLTVRAVCDADGCCPRPAVSGLITLIPILWPLDAQKPGRTLAGIGHSAGVGGISLLTGGSG